MGSPHTSLIPLHTENGPPDWLWMENNMKVSSGGPPRINTNLRVLSVYLEGLVSMGSLKEIPK